MGEGEIIPKTILYCTDFSENSRIVGRYAQAYAMAFSSDLLVLHVIQSWEGFPSYQDRFKNDIQQIIQKVEESVDAELALLGDEFSQDAKAVVTFSRMGIPAREIVRLADEESVDLIVLGTRGRTGLKHVLLGSVAENVIKMSKCPVLVVRAPTAADER